MELPVRMGNDLHDGRFYARWTEASEGGHGHIWPSVCLMTGLSMRPASIHLQTNNSGYVVENLFCCNLFFSDEYCAESTHH